MKAMERLEVIEMMLKDLYDEYLGLGRAMERAGWKELAYQCRECSLSDVERLLDEVKALRVQVSILEMGKVRP